VSDISYCVGSSGTALGLLPMFSRIFKLTGATVHLRHDRLAHDLAEMLLLAELSESTDVHMEVIFIGEHRDEMRQLDGQIFNSLFESDRWRRLLGSSAGKSKTEAPK
jgi:hypothetical protein